MIGVFDSGLGGLTVLKEIEKQIPDEDYIYLGDTLHVPYGNRSDEAIYDLTSKACDFLFTKGCSLIILACNTATAKALRRLQQEYLPNHFGSDHKNNILGVIRPVAEYVAQKSSGGIGVIGTRGTINSEAYVVELKNQNESLRVVQQATPLLVPLIEEGWAKSVEIDTILAKYLKELDKRGKVKALILGCTHYPLIIDKIRVQKPDCFIPNPGEIVAHSLHDYLLRHPEYQNKKNKPITEYYVTDFSENFNEIAEQFLNKKININKVAL